MFWGTIEGFGQHGRFWLVQNCVTGLRQRIYETECLHIRDIEKETGVMLYRPTFVESSR